MRDTLLFFIFLLSLTGRETFAKDVIDSSSSMSGYKLSDFPDFEKKWRLVTVRYRKDTGEQRFTYANELAWKTLQNHSVKYSDGAAFIKVGLATQEDPAFSSSAVPSGARRYQVMVRNAAKHKETDGWGYALFDREGHVFPDSPTNAPLACAACHRLVADRGYVFSEILNLAPFGKGSSKMALNEKISELRLKFETADIQNLPDAVKAALPAALTGQIRLLKGDLTEHIFHGTLDEIRPSLAVEAVRSKLPVALISQDGQQYSVVVFDKKSLLCKKEKASQIDMIGISSDPQLEKTKFKTLSFCQNVQ